MTNKNQALQDLEQDIIKYCDYLENSEIYKAYKKSMEVDSDND